MHDPCRIETKREPKKKPSKVEVKNKPSECLQPVEGFFLKKCELESQKAKTFNKKHNRDLPEHPLNKYKFEQKHEVLESGKTKSVYTLTPPNKDKKK